MRHLAIIPARGGSKRIPRQNLREFLGRPVIAYSIEAAAESGLFDEIMVSTDDEEIAALAEQYGANVPFMRSPENANDHATTVDVLLEVLDHYQKKGVKFHYGCCIYPVAPFVTGRRLFSAFLKMRRHDYDCVFPVTPFNYPVQRALRLNDGRLELLYPEFEKARSQDLETSYHDSGQFYWFNVERLRQKKSLMTDNTGAIILNELEVQDIDNEIDWKMAELKYRSTHYSYENRYLLQSRRA
ncbi:MAG: pseudaminic acid cytidylyltransferase [Bacteroidetes bacterium]|nr:MAG: pseudaminic acid cytidylyltransferase [Bacteroidota bacterium]